MKPMTTQQPKITLCELGESEIAGLESYSPFCLKVHRALKVIGFRYASRHGRPPQFSDLSPAAQVPILLVDEDEVIPDSTRILMRLDELSVARGGPSLLPDDPRARAEAWLWEDFADRALNGYVVAARWADDRNWPLVREAYFKGAPWFVKNLIAPRIRSTVLKNLVARDVLRAGEEACWEDFRRTLDHLEELAPTRGFWVTRDMVTVADLSIFAQLHAIRTRLTEAQARDVMLRPALSDYLDRVDEATISRGSRALLSTGLTALAMREIAPMCPSPMHTLVLA